MYGQKFTLPNEEGGWYKWSLNKKEWIYYKIRMITSDYRTEPYPQMWNTDHWMGAIPGMWIKDVPPLPITEEGRECAECCDGLLHVCLPKLHDDPEFRALIASMVEETLKELGAQFELRPHDGGLSLVTGTRRPIYQDDITPEG